MSEDSQTPTFRLQRRRTCPPRPRSCKSTLLLVPPPTHPREVRMPPKGPPQTRATATPSLLRVTPSMVSRGSRKSSPEGRDRRGEATMLLLPGSAETGSRACTGTHAVCAHSSSAPGGRATRSAASSALRSTCSAAVATRRTAIRIRTKKAGRRRRCRDNRSRQLASARSSRAINRTRVISRAPTCSCRCQSTWETPRLGRSPCSRAQAASERACPPPASCRAGGPRLHCCSVSRVSSRAFRFREVSSRASRRVSAADCTSTRISPSPPWQGSTGPDFPAVSRLSAALSLRSRCRCRSRTRTRSRSLTSPGINRLQHRCPRS